MPSLFQRIQLFQRLETTSPVARESTRRRTDYDEELFETEQVPLHALRQEMQVEEASRKTYAGPPGPLEMRTVRSLFQFRIQHEATHEAQKAQRLGEEARSTATAAAHHGLTTLGTTYAADGSSQTRVEEVKTESMRAAGHN